MVPVMTPEEMAQDMGISPTNKYYEICLRRQFNSRLILAFLLD